MSFASSCLLELTKCSTFMVVQEPVGDILVFLTGQDDIDAAVQLINENAQDHRSHSSGM